MATVSVMPSKMFLYGPFLTVHFLSDQAVFPDSGQKTENWAYGCLLRYVPSGSLSSCTSCWEILLNHAVEEKGG